MGIDLSTVELVMRPSGRVRCEGEWRLDEAWSRRLPDFNLWYVWAGRGWMRLVHPDDGSEQEIELRPGVCLWMRPGNWYLASHDPKDRLGVNYLHFVFNAASHTPADLPPEVRRVPDAAYFDALTRRVVDLWRELGGEHLRVTTLMRAALMEYAASPALNEEAVAGLSAEVKQMADAMASRIREDPSRKWSVAEMADEAGYCPDHFSRIFNAAHNISPQAFVIHCRIERACQLLRETRLTNKQIARALGYSSVFFFSRQFARVTGVPPTRYRSGR